MDELLQDFIAETRETLEALSGEIVAWEAQPDDRHRLDAIFRFVHTVKGSCGFLDLPRLARLSHAAEEALSQVREGQRAADTAFVNAVLAIVDRIEALVDALDSGTAVNDSDEDLLIAGLTDAKDATVCVLPPAVSENAPATVARAQTRSVRLSVDLLDRMMSGMSDMVLARNELSRCMRSSELDPSVEAALERLSLTVAEMRDTVTLTRMQKIDALFSALPRIVRDTAASVGKSVSLQVEGGEVELDREMIEVMRDPLMHIIRNSIDHGIESPADRRAAGKRESGRLVASARQSGNQIVIEISDDGRGVDTDRLIEKLVANGGDERALRSLSPKGRLDLMFEPGLSSREVVSEISGRGVGMDVVRTAIEQIGGRIELDNTPGRGLRIAIHVPLTLSIIPAIVVGAGGQRFAIPRQSIEEIVTEGGEAIRVDRLGGGKVLTVRGRRMPLLDLCELLELEHADSDSKPLIAIVSVPEGSYALIADTVLDTEELVIKPASPAVMACGIYAGQTLPDSGQPMLLLDCAGLATIGGVQFVHDPRIEENVEEVLERQQVCSALLFKDLDGARRAVPLAAVDRVEQIQTDRVRTTGGQARVTIDDRILPLVTMGSLQERRQISLLRLKDDTLEVCYAIEEAIDIIELPEVITPTRERGPISGVMLVDGAQIEVIDTLWLLDAHAHGTHLTSHQDRPLCLLQGDEADWMGSFVRPLLERSGYRVTTELRAGETADVVLASDDGSSGVASNAPIVRLRSERTSLSGAADSVYRYDRAGLLSALEARVRVKASA